LTRNFTAVSNGKQNENFSIIQNIFLRNKHKLKASIWLDYIFPPPVDADAVHMAGLHIHLQIQASTERRKIVSKNGYKTKQMGN